VKVLLLGGGGREHAIGWKLAQSPHLDGLISVPGNPGLAALGAVIPGVDPADGDAVAAIAEANAVDLVVVGPEAPLAAGVVDALSAAGVPAFGPTRDGAQLEASKAFAKGVMVRAGVPTAAARSFTSIAAAERHLAAAPPPYVVKADGLAAGKGVLVTPDLEAAKAWARLCLGGGFGEAGEVVVIEEHLDGREVSVFAICDGSQAVPLEPARDYKRLENGDEGPNTGGMGCFSPVADLDPDLVHTTMRTVVDPVLATLAADGIPYRGFLYAGLMLTADGPKVLEFNCRLGDPETQVVLPRLETDLLELLAGAAAGNLAVPSLRWSTRAAVDVVLAAPGYPESPEIGAAIRGLEAVEGRDDVLVFHAGTRMVDGELVTAGGRVLNVVGLGGDVATARALAYDAADLIEFPGRRYRTDIAEE
jgi:phosphoribosylamine---glycine ligase